MHAVTMHQSPGRQADKLTVLMPHRNSRLLTRELFSTAVTRAKNLVRVVVGEAEVRGAVE
jgi:exodeoxyribonuclease V alpha subunit